jgi:hypothetical protein
MKTVKIKSKASALSATKVKVSTPARAEVAGAHAETIKALKARPRVAAELKRLEPELVMLDAMVKARC